MSVMEQQNGAFQLKDCCTKMILEEDYRLAVAGRTLVVMVVVVCDEAGYEGADCS
jgi:hypothetical protein